MTQLAQIRVPAREGPAVMGRPRTLFERRDHGSFRFESTREARLVRKASRAIDHFDMIDEGDRIMVCLSGGKDSYALLDALRIIQRRSPVRFELLAINVDQGWPGYDVARIEEHLLFEGVNHFMASADYARVVEKKLRPGQTPCVLCSRFRRGFLYELARRMGCTKIALGHHLDDIIETFVLNMFFSGRLASMPPKLVSKDQNNVVIRPLVYVLEDEVRDYANERNYPIVACGCLSCGLPDQKRQVVKRMLADAERAHGGIKHNMLAALGNISPGQLLDKKLMKLAALGALDGAEIESPADV